MNKPLIYVYDNGGQYSDYEMFFIGTVVPKEHWEPLLQRCNSSKCKLIAIAHEMEWFVGGPQSLGDILDPSKPFYKPWAYDEMDNEKYPQMYQGGGWEHGSEAQKILEEKTWSRAKYKIDDGLCVNPDEEIFGMINLTIAPVLVADWRRHGAWDLWINLFEQECRERGLLP